MSDNKMLVIKIELFLWAIVSIATTACIGYIYYIYQSNKSASIASETAAIASLKQSLELLESREDVSNYPIDGELASAFVLNSKNTDVQRENLLKEIKGKVIIWDVKVYEVKKIAEKVYRIQTSDKGIFFGKKVVGAFIEITAKDTLEANFIEQIMTDQIIRIKGIFTGDSSARNINIKPAILWNDESKLKSNQSVNNSNKEEVVISKFPRCNGSHEIEKCEATEEALIKSTEDNIQRQNNHKNDRENKFNNAQTESNIFSPADLENAQKNFDKTPNYSSGRYDLFANFIFKYDPHDRILDGNNIYFEILYNQLFDDFEPFNWDSMFIKAFILMREKHPSWTWKDQIDQISLDQAAMGGHNYLRAANDLIVNWGPGYALFLKSPLYLSSKDLDIMKKDIRKKFNDCQESINQLPPSNRPRKSFCRGYATTGKVLNIKIS